MDELALKTIVAANNSLTAIGWLVHDILASPPPSMEVVDRSRADAEETPEAILGDEPEWASILEIVSLDRRRGVELVASALPQ
jgi:hypothetical protein